jgi:DNA-binding FrmR family transcriptional regulator
MPSIDVLAKERRDDIVDRLKRIEGQAKGVQRMVVDGRECVDVLNQVAAIKAAVNALGAEVLESFALYCLRHPEDFETPEDAVGRAVQALVRSGR